MGKRMNNSLASSFQPPAFPLLAIDPSLRSTGFAILEGTDAKVRCLEYGVIHNPPALSVPACLKNIHERLTVLVAQYHPEAMALEQIIYVKSLSVAIVMGSARGAALLAAAQAGLSVYEYPPKRIKQAVVGRGDAAKTQVGFMVRALLGLRETPPSDAADAIAIGLTHLRAMATALPANVKVSITKKEVEGLKG